jgi:hypothetical protein
MKKLNEAQLREVGVYNFHNFVASSVVACYNVPKSHATYTRLRGWYLLDTNSRHYRLSLSSTNAKKPPNKLTPYDLTQELSMLIKDVPKRWVRVLDAWVPEDFYTTRMAELVEAYKQLKEPTV